MPCMARSAIGFLSAKSWSSGDNSATNSRIEIGWNRDPQEFFIGCWGWMRRVRRDLSQVVGFILAMKRANIFKEIEMKELTRKEKDLLLGYCMKPENIEIALATGYLQTELREQILLSFAKELDENVKKKLKEKKLDWKSKVSEPKKLRRKGVYTIYEMKRKNFRIELVCSFWNFCEEKEKYEMWVGAPSEGNECPEKELLDSCFEGKDIKLACDREKEPNWFWWFYPNGYSDLDNLSTMHHDSRMIDELAKSLVFFSEIISKELEK